MQFVPLSLRAIPDINRGGAAISTIGLKLMFDYIILAQARIHTPFSPLDSSWSLPRT
jgi:hypothetical protein